MNKYFFVIILFLSILNVTQNFAPVLGAAAFAEEHSHQKNHSHKKSQHKHVHGEVEGSIAFDGVKGQFEFEIPGDSFVGFENAPKNDQQKQKIKDAELLFEKEFFKMLQFEVACKLIKIEFENKIEGKHSSFSAKGEIECDKSIKNTSVSFDFKTFFKGFSKVDLQVIVDDLQKSMVVKSKNQKLDLK